MPKLSTFRFKVKLNSYPSFDLHYDVDYGMDKRKGWSVAINGSFYVELVSNPFVAVLTAIKKHRAAVKDMAAEELRAASTAPDEIETPANPAASALWRHADSIWARMRDEHVAFNRYLVGYSSGSVYFDDLAKQYDAAVEAAKAVSNG